MKKVKKANYRPKPAKGKGGNVQTPSYPVAGQRKGYKKS